MLTSVLLHICTTHGRIDTRCTSDNDAVNLNLAIRSQISRSGCRHRLRHITGLDSCSVGFANSPDRPGFSTGPQTVQAGHLQFEAGYGFDYDHRNDFQDHTAPEALLRLGAVEDLELRLSWVGHTWTRSSGNWTDDDNDLAAGLKLQLTHQQDLLPTVAVLGMVSVPTGGRTVSSGSTDPSLGLLAAYTLPDGLNLFETVVATSTTDSTSRRVLQVGAAAGAAFPITDKLGAYIEYFTIFGDRITPTHNLDGGFTYLLTPNLQLDIEMGEGLNDRARDLFFGTGIAWRW